MERRIVAQLLACLDDLGTNAADAPGEVLVLGATSRPEALDPALRRAGRFDREVRVGIPDARARESILHVLTRAVRLAPATDLRALARQTPGFVGADLQALTREAALAAVSRVLLEEEQKKAAKQFNISKIQQLKDKMKEKEKEKENLKKEILKENEKNEKEKNQKEKSEKEKNEKEKNLNEKNEKEKNLKEKNEKEKEEEKNEKECDEKVKETKDEVKDSKDLSAKVEKMDTSNSDDKDKSSPSGKDDPSKPTEKKDSENTKDKKEDENMEVIDISDRDTPKDSGSTLKIISSKPDSKTALPDEDDIQIEAEVSCSDFVKEKGTSKGTPSPYADEDMEVLEEYDEEIVPLCESTTIGEYSKTKNSVWSSQFPALSDEQLQNLFITQEDFESALKHVQPSAKREGFATVPDISWDDVGALRDVREELQMAILAPVRHPEAFESLGLTAPAGLLLCGPPGCGKTLIAKAIANEADINFISVKGPELLNMYVGESEKAVRQCFLRARNSAPCVIFFDELDALCPRRTGGPAGEGSSATQRVVNQLLTEMDGVEGRRGVFLLAASNRPDILDPAVLRPGRLDRVVFVGLPKADARADILRALTKDGTRPRFADDVDLQALGESDSLDGCSGADLAALVREAATLALREHLAMAADTLADSTEPRPAPYVHAKHLQQAVRRLRPSVSPQERLRYEVIRRQFSIPGQEMGSLLPLVDPASPESAEAQLGSSRPSSVDPESKQQSPSSSVPVAPIAIPTASA